MICFALCMRCHKLRRQIWVRGPAVEDWFKAAVLDGYEQQPELTDPRVEIPPELGTNWRTFAETAASRIALFARPSVFGSR